MSDRAWPTRVALMLRYAAAVLVISALSALQLPYQFGNGNQVFQLPTVYRLIEPELYPDDPLVASLRNYPSAAYPALAWLSRSLGIGVERLYLSVWLIERVWLVAMLMILAARFVPDLWGRVFVTLAASTTQWAVGRTLIGGEHIFTQHLTHTDLAFALQLPALAAWLYRRPVLAAALAGGALYLNAMTTVHLVGFMVLLWTFDERRWDRRHLLALATFVVLALPWAAELRAAVGGTSGAAQDTARFWELLRIRRGPHYFVDGWDLTALASIAAVFWLIGRRAGTERLMRRMMIAGLAYTAAMFVVAWLGVHVGSSKLAVLLHPLRGDKWLHVALIVAVPVFLWREAGLTQRMWALLPAIGGAFMLGHAPPATALSVVPLLVAGALAVGAGRLRWLSVASAFAAIGVGCLALAGSRLFGATLLLGTCAGGLAACTRRVRPAILGLVCVIALVQIGRHSIDPGRLGLAWYRAGEDPAWVEMAQWAASDTPVSARFITPPYLEGWRCLSRRGALVEYRDGSAMHWQAGFEAGWWERLQSVHCDVYYSAEGLAGELERRYLALTPADLVAAAGQYGIHYVVMPAGWPNAGRARAIHANEGFRAFTVEELR
ncbi:MAG: DUF6798 domain-containing protein, partial [Armatimonadota bacterium]